jgi:phenylpropionate dioxygenase-like ring-hydroxylating dioxygenase large terminal subunit
MASPLVPSGLDPVAYTDEAIFELERQRIFAGSWLPVCREEDVAQHGDYVASELLGDPIVIVRTREAGLSALANVCRHRNMVMMSGAGNAKAIQCPYHMWTYSLDGELTAAPDTAELGAVDSATFCLPHLAVEIWNGFVLVNTNPDAASFASAVGGFEASLGGVPIYEMVRVGAVTWDQPWNWKTTFENYAESYHHQGIHRETLQPFFPASDSAPTTGRDEPWMRLDHRAAADGIDALVVTAVYPLLWPTFVGTDAMTWLRIEPHSAQRSTLVTEVFVHESRRDDVDFVEFQLESVRVINAEDEVPNAGVAAGLNSRFAVRAALHPLEDAITHFHAWYRQRLGETI